MLTRVAIRLMVMTLALACAETAAGQDKIHDYLNATAQRVKATESGAEKRAILSKSLDAMTRAIATVESAPLTSKQDAIGLDRLQATLQEKSDELAGANGFDRIPDNQLDAFAIYVVQDMEQAHGGTISISVVTLLLIIIILLLIA